MAIIELNIAGWTFTHGVPDADRTDAPGVRQPWQVPRINVRRNDWSSLLRRARAA